MMKLMHCHYEMSSTFGYIVIKLYTLDTLCKFFSYIFMSASPGVSVSHNIIIIFLLVVYNNDDDA